MGRNYIPKEIKTKVFERAEFRCEYCFSLDLYSSSPFNIEHIIPVTKNGTDNFENLALSCHGCNLHKYNKIFGIDNETSLLAALYDPRQDKWINHFKWNEEFTLMIGLTPTGRATINALKLNRFRLINQRIVFRNINLHPPEFTVSK